MIQVGSKTNTGILRDKNEDALHVMSNNNIYIVADGVGGNNAGEVASQMAVRGIAKYVEENPIENCREDGEIREYFSECIEKVNREIYMISKSNLENSGMATTIVIGYIRNDKIYFINIGDSRGYVLRRGALSQVTDDHTYVNVLLKQGLINEEEAKNHEKKNMITRAIGADERVEPDFFRSRIEKGDIILLCTDGLYGEVSEEEMIKILDKQLPMTEVASELVEKAITNGGSDNITVICAKV